MSCNITTCSVNCDSQIEFADVLAEPDAAHSNSCLWKTSYVWEIERVSNESSRQRATIWKGSNQSCFSHVTHIFTHCFRCFTGSKTCMYRLFALLCGCCMALEWGCVFGASAFLGIYVYTPFVYMCGFWTYCVRGICGACFQCLVGPIVEISGLLFTNISVTKHVQDNIVPKR